MCDFRIISSFAICLFTSKTHSMFVNGKAGGKERKCLVCVFKMNAGSNKIKENGENIYIFKPPKVLSQKWRERGGNNVI